MKEWKDFGEALKGSIYHNDTGIHIPNSEMDTLEKELNDVQRQYEQLEGSKWARAYDRGIEAATSNHQAQNVAENFQAFKKSAEGKAFKKEMIDLKRALKQNVKVSDIPEEWKNMNMLKVKIHDKEDIEEEWNDVE